MKDDSSLKVFWSGHGLLNKALLEIREKGGKREATKREVIENITYY